MSDRQSAALGFLVLIVVLLGLWLLFGESVDKFLPDAQAPTSAR